MENGDSLRYHIHVTTNNNGDVVAKIEERPFPSDESLNEIRISTSPIVHNCKSEVSKLKKLTLTIRTTYNMCRSGMSDMEIARKRGLSVTICGHLCHLIKQDLANVKDVVDENILLKISEYIRTHESTRLSDIYNYFDGIISFKIL